jgi:DNA-3-methyladenine glycosylase
MAILQRDFYERDPIEVARQLLGKRLMRRGRSGLMSGWIVEVEAYLAEGDSACHAARGRTRSNAAMFGRAGLAYVYPIHSRYCFNVVTQRRGCASAVLVRAVRPLDGIRLMQRRRGSTATGDLARGPARLCEAFEIDRRLDHWDLTWGRRLWIEDHGTARPVTDAVGASTRIGVTSAQDQLLRFYFVDCPYVSGSRRRNASYVPVT